MTWSYTFIENKEGELRIKCEVKRPNPMLNDLLNFSSVYKNKSNENFLNLN